MVSSPVAPSTTRTQSRARTVLLLVAGAVVAGIANSIVAFSALAAGARADFSPLLPAVYLPFTVLGLLAGYLGWRIVRARATQPLRVLRVLVPVLFVLSFLPDTVLLLTGFIPGATPNGVVALMLIHPIVVAVGVPLYQRLAPVTATR